MPDRDTWQYQGRQQHGWFGSGTAPDAGITRASSVTPGATAPPPPYIATDPTTFVGRDQVGTGECVALVQRATGAPLTSSWHAGEPLDSNPAPPGTAAATFDPDGRYGNHADQTSHALIITEWTPRGFSAVEQFNVKDAAGNIVHRIAPRTRFYEFRYTGGKPIDNGSNYRVIRQLDRCLTRRKHMGRTSFGEFANPMSDHARSPSVGQCRDIPRASVKADEPASRPGWLGPLTGVVLTGRPIPRL